MILKGLEATRYCARPDAGKAGPLVCGSGPMRRRMKWKRVIAALDGPQSEGEEALAHQPAPPAVRTSWPPPRPTGGPSRPPCSRLLSRPRAGAPGSRVEPRVRLGPPLSAPT